MADWQPIEGQMMEQVAQDVVTHIRNGRAPSRSHVFGCGETWCGKKLVGEPETLDCGTEVFSSYGAIVQASIDPARCSCRSCRNAFDAAYSEAFPDGPTPIATLRLDEPADMNLAKAFFWELYTKLHQHQIAGSLNTGNQGRQFLCGTWCRGRASPCRSSWCGRQNQRQ